MNYLNCLTPNISIVSPDTLKWVYLAGRLSQLLWQCPMGTNSSGFLQDLCQFRYIMWPRGKNGWTKRTVVGQSLDILDSSWYTWHTPWYIAQWWGDLKLQHQSLSGSRHPDSIIVRFPNPLCTQHVGWGSRLAQVVNSSSSGLHWKVVLRIFSCLYWGNFLEFRHWIECNVTRLQSVRVLLLVRSSYWQVLYQSYCWCYSRASIEKVSGPSVKSDRYPTFCGFTHIHVGSRLVSRRIEFGKSWKTTQCHTVSSDVNVSMELHHLGDQF